MENDRLDANIYLAARPRNSLSLDFDITHSNIQRLGIGLGAALITRNVFGGANQILVMVQVKAPEKGGKYKDIFNSDTLGRVKYFRGWG